MPSRLPSRKSKIFRRLRFDTPASASFETARRQIKKRDTCSILFGGVEIVLRDLTRNRFLRREKDWDRIRKDAKSIIAAVKSGYGNNITKIILHNGALVQVFVGNTIAKLLPSYAKNTSSSAFDCRTSLGGSRARAETSAGRACPDTKKDFENPPEAFVDNTPNAVQTLDTSSFDLKELSFDEEWGNIDMIEDAIPSSLCSSPCLSPKVTSVAALFSSTTKSDKEFVMGTSNGVLCGVSETDNTFFGTCEKDAILNISEVCI